MSAERQAPEIIREAVGELRALRADERARQLAEDRERAIIAKRLEAAAQYDAGAAKGRAEGLAEGEAKGRAEGLKLNAIAVAHRLLSRGVAVADVAVIAGLSEAEVRALAQANESDSTDPS